MAVSTPPMRHSAAITETLFSLFCLEGQERLSVATSRSFSSATRPSYATLFVDMTGYKNNSFSRRLPDVVTEELVIVLSEKTSYEFKQLFEVVHDNLRRRNAAHGGQELLRLRAYEKLHNLVSRGAVKKNGKIYTGNSAALGAMAANVHHAASITSNP